MKHCGTQQLETKRLILRRFRPEDAAAMYHNWASDDEVTKYLMWPTHSSIEVSQYVTDDWVNSYSKDDFYQWAIVPKEFKEPIGSISVVRQEGDTFEIGYCIGKHWWHQGIVSEALTAVMDYLFDEVGMNRIEAKHDVNNPHSGGVMKKCGMRYEGTSRQSDRNNQGICDLVTYGILRSDRQ